MAISVEMQVNIVASMKVQVNMVISTITVAVLTGSMCPLNHSGLIYIDTLKVVMTETRDRHPKHTSRFLMYQIPNVYPECLI